MTAWTLSRRLSVVFAVLLLACSGVSAWLQMAATDRHEREVTQRLSLGLAAHIAGNAELMQRGGLNTECKLMLLGHAFEKLDCIAVEFRTHFFNHQSRKAIERLGAKQDGILRSHQIAPNGSLRDTVVYSIVASEWPTVKAHLRFQLVKPRN